MSFIKNENGITYEAGSFLADDECTRLTRQFNAGMGNNGVVPAGTIYPTNDENAEGIVYEPVDVSDGAAAGSVVVAGKVVESRLAVELEEEAKTALEAGGIIFVAENDTVTRPY